MRPQESKELEMSLLGMLTMQTDAIYSAMPRLFEDLFYHDASKVVYNAIKSLFDSNSTIDLVTIYTHIVKNGDSEKLGGMHYLTKMQDYVQTSNPVDTHISLLSEMYLKRELFRITQNLGFQALQNETDAFALSSELQSEVENATTRILSGQKRDIAHFVHEMLSLHYEVKKTGVLGLKTGLDAIDKDLGGLVSPDLIVIAARPGQGKTALALSLTYHISIQNGIPGAWFSLEMDGVQLVRRLASIASGIEHYRIKDGKTDEYQEKRLQEISGMIAEKKIHIEDAPMCNIRDIRGKAHLLAKKHGIKYIIVDYLQLITGDNGKPREQVVSEISRGLKILAKELKIPIVALSQLNRGPEQREDKLPNLSDLRESGAIEQDADSVLFIMRPEYYQIETYHNMPTQNLAVIKIDKNRHGATGAKFAHFDNDKMLFSNYSEIPF